jgi:hypothetical protein
MRCHVQGGSNVTGTDLCVNKPHKSRSYLNHLVYYVLTVMELVSVSCLYVLAVRSLDLCKHNGRFNIKKRRFNFAIFIRNSHVELQEVRVSSNISCLLCIK